MSRLLSVPESSTSFHSTYTGSLATLPLSCPPGYRPNSCTWGILPQILMPSCRPARGAERPSQGARTAREVPVEEQRRVEGGSSPAESPAALQTPPCPVARPHTARASAAQPAHLNVLPSGQTPSRGTSDHVLSPLGPRGLLLVNHLYSRPGWIWTLAATWPGWHPSAQQVAGPLTPPLWSAGGMECETMKNEFFSSSSQFFFFFF